MLSMYWTREWYERPNFKVVRGTSWNQTLMEILSRGECKGSLSVSLSMKILWEFYGIKTNFNLYTFYVCFL